MNADSAFYCMKVNDRYQAKVIEGTNSQLLDGLDPDVIANDLFSLQPDNDEIKLITQDDDSFYEVSPQVAAIGAEAIAVVDVSERRVEKSHRLLILLFSKKPTTEEWREAQNVLDILADNMREVLNNQLHIKKFSGAYIHILKTLAVLQDNLDPFTIGYSELMSRYSVVIAKEMGLEEDMIKDIALAAYLSNIGVMGISGDIKNKEGK